jgi:ADP-heptose:LPS heptosyltransferase
MKFNFPQKLLTPYLKLSARFMINRQIINFMDAIMDARHILVIMPEKLEDFGVARNYLTVLKRNFPKARITLTMKEQYQNLFDQSHHFGTIFVTASSRNVLGLPKKELIQKISGLKSDIAIDLNHTFQFFSTYICLKSGAKLRIGLEDSERDVYYNLSFRTQQSEKLENKYRKMFKYLDATAKGNS